jgi:hypothetical protein
MSKSKKIPKDFTVIDGWEELRILLESLNKDLKKSITKGTKRSGINARKGLMYAKELITDIYHASLLEQKIAREKRPVHKNSDGAGIKAMHESRKIKS